VAYPVKASGVIGLTCRSIGAALGLAAAYKPSGRRVVAVIGDGAFQIGPQVRLVLTAQGPCNWTIVLTTRMRTSVLSGLTCTHFPDVVLLSWSRRLPRSCDSA
jgi:Thiamine pyrophosphate enzyme, C-terminal TPP binding domain